MLEETTNASSSVRAEHWYLRPSWIFGGLLAFSLALYVALIPVPRRDGQLIGGDGVGYYVYLRSLFMDHDLDFTNEYAYYLDKSVTAGSTPLHRPHNKYAVGPALLWTPFFLIAHLLALAANRLGLYHSPDGYGYLYQAAISIGSIIYGAIALLLAYRCSRHVFSQQSALIAVVLIWLGSNVPYYMVFEPSLSHMVSMFAVSLLLSVWFFNFRNTRSPSFLSSAIFGATAGLVLLVRLQDAPFLLLPLGFFVVRITRELRNAKFARAVQWGLCGGLAGTCCLITFFPQLIVWQRLYGAWTAFPYVQDHVPPFYWVKPHIMGVLFSTFHGLFIWHPIFVFSIIGLVIMLGRSAGLPLILLCLLAVNIYIVAAWWAWWQGDSFGGRMLLNSIWIWLFGLSAFISRLRRIQGRLRRPCFAGGVVLIFWNVLSLMQYRLGFVPMGAPLTWEQMTIERFEVPWLILKKLL